ncbi:MAG: HPr family phosphocarrier protein, partial [Steroidobacteraceae bacterium]
MANLTLVSPLRGWCAPLDETPDAVFAQRLLGDGVAIDPTDGALHAPCDGEVGDPLLELRSVSGEAKAPRGEPASQEVSERVTIGHDHGIHARPAALIANLAKTSAAEIAIAVRGRSANAKSAVALMSLGAQRGEELTLVASGDGAAKAVGELKRLILSLDEKAGSVPTPALVPSPV